jgi:hypothetical protein
MALLHDLVLHCGLDAWCRILLPAAVLLVVLHFFSVARSTACLPAELLLVLILALIVLGSSPGIGVGALMIISILCWWGGVGLTALLDEQVYAHSPLGPHARATTG